MPTSCALSGEPADSARVPWRNQGADDAIEPHHTAVAAVITTMATAAPAARSASAQRTGRGRSRRRAAATAAAVQSASATATRSMVKTNSTR